VFIRKTATRNKSTSEAHVRKIYHALAVDAAPGGVQKLTV
jgi:hypothetical protein